MIINDIVLIKQMISDTIATEQKRGIKFDLNDFQPLLDSKSLAVVDITGEELSNMSIIARREIHEIGTNEVKNVILHISCSSAYGINPVELSKLNCVIQSFANGTDLMWACITDETMPMSKIRITIYIAK